jgi:hypothetical protein
MTALLLSRWQHATMEVPLFPQPAEHVAHHHRCRQPQQPQSGNGRSSLPSQHKADCCVERGQIVGDSLIRSLSLSLHHSRPTAASCLPSSLLYRLPQPAPPPFIVLLCPTYSVDCRVARWPPSTSQPAPLTLFTPCPHLLVVALCCITLSVALAFPPPFITPPPLVAPLLFGWWLRCVAWCPGLSLCPEHWPLIRQPPLVAPLCPPADATFLLRYCASLVQLIVMLLGGLPPPLSRCLRLSSRLLICWLSHHIASHCLMPWPSPPLSSHLRLSLRPSCLVGGCVVLPGSPASLSARHIGLSSRSRLSLRHRAPLLTQRFYSTPPFDVSFDIVKQFKLACQWGDSSTKMHAIWMYYCTQMAAATIKQQSAIVTA